VLCAHAPLRPWRVLLATAQKRGRKSVPQRAPESYDSARPRAACPVLCAAAGRPPLVHTDADCARAAAASAHTPPLRSRAHAQSQARGDAQAQAALPGARARGARARARTHTHAHVQDALLLPAWHARRAKPTA
jgi:hypothetical protein